ncbi:MAG TPA: hotdog fold thioesterase [Bacteroidia bacterium]|nr:hotdog fold thioesterase [Bacteroidia bacterium]
MKAEDVVNTMMRHDAFSRWLGIKVLEVKEGYCKLGMKIREDMLNGFGIAHGGITYSFADSALAFASNSWGRKSLSIETSVSHTESLHANEEIMAEAVCIQQSEKLGHYDVKIYRVDDPAKPCALFRGIVYKTSGYW